MLVTPDLPARSAKPCMGEPERPKDEMDALDMCAHMKSDVGNLKRPAKMPVTLDLPATDVELCMSKPEWLTSQMDTLNMCTHVQRIVNDSRKPTERPEHVRIPENGCIKPKTAENASRKVKMCYRRPKMRNSPIGHEIETVKHPGWWKHISDEGNNTNAPQNAPIKLLGTWNREIAFELLLERYLVAEARCCSQCWRRELSWCRDGK